MSTKGVSKAKRAKTRPGSSKKKTVPVAQTDAQADWARHLQNNALSSEELKSVTKNSVQMFTLLRSLMEQTPSLIAEREPLPTGKRGKRKVVVQEELEGEEEEEDVVGAESSSCSEEEVQDDMERFPQTLAASTPTMIRYEDLQDEFQLHTSKHTIEFYRPTYSIELKSANISASVFAFSLWFLHTRCSLSPTSPPIKKSLVKQLMVLFHKMDVHDIIDSQYAAAYTQLSRRYGTRSNPVSIRAPAHDLDAAFSVLESPGNHLVTRKMITSDKKVRRIRIGVNSTRITPQRMLFFCMHITDFVYYALSTDHDDMSQVWARNTPKDAAMRARNHRVMNEPETKLCGVDTDCLCLNPFHSKNPNVVPAAQRNDGLQFEDNPDADAESDMLSLCDGASDKSSIMGTDEEEEDGEDSDVEEDDDEIARQIKQLQELQAQRKRKGRQQSAPTPKRVKKKR